MSPEQLLPHLEKLRNDAVDVRNRLSLRFAVRSMGDPRRAVARHVKAAVSASYLNLIHIHENLQEPSWWHRQGFSGAMANGNVPDELEDSLVLLTASLAVFPFSLFEAGLRRIVRSVDPTACNGGAREFKTIYDWLFKRLLAPGFNKREEIGFLDVYRNVRNTIHNNGHFYSRTGGDQSIGWKGVNYHFQNGQLPAFIDWLFHLRMVRELLRLTEAVMTDPLVEPLPDIP